MQNTFNKVRLGSKLIEDIFSNRLSNFFIRPLQFRSFSCRRFRIKETQKISVLSSFCFEVGSRFGRLSRHHFRSFTRRKKSRLGVFLSVFFDDKSTLNERRRFTDVLKIVSKPIRQTIQSRQLDLKQVWNKMRLLIHIQCIELRWISYTHLHSTPSI